MSIVSYERVGDVGVITLNNPLVNAFSLEAASELRALLVRIGHDDMRAVLTRAAGPNSCAGADVNMFSGRTYRSARGLLSETFDLINLIESLPIPTVCAVQGLCMAAGMEVMLAYDIAIAGASARIGQSEALIGTTTLAGGAQRIAARAGGRTREGDGLFGQAVRRFDAGTMECRQRDRPGCRTCCTRRGMRRAACQGSHRGSWRDQGRAGWLCCRRSGGRRQGHDLRGRVLFETDDMKSGVKALLERGSRAVAAGGLQFYGR